VTKILSLGIETSCDETAVAVLEYDPVSGSSKILSEEVSSQSDLHSAYGGVVPELASREHLTNLPLLIDVGMKRAALQFSDLSVIGVTRGPGLKGCLLIGLGVAQGISLSHKLPIVGVNHIEGHILSARLDNPELNFPYLSLVVSGGHTEILEVTGVGQYGLVARTIDDAAGEAFDKSANLLGFEYPGGAKLAALADQFSKTNFKLPKVMREAQGFSFSGLKTAISLLVKEHSAQLGQDSNLKGELAYAIQDSIIDALVYKLKEALSSTRHRSVAVVGGVSANSRLRAVVSELRNCKVYFAKPEHCVDNAAMIAYTAALRFAAGERLSAGVEVLSRWPVESMTVPHG